MLLRRARACLAPSMLHISRSQALLDLGRRGWMIAWGWVRVLVRVCRVYKNAAHHPAIVSNLWVLE